MFHSAQSTQPQSQERTMQRSMVLPNQFKESESLSKIQRWLEMGELALGEKKGSVKQRPA